MHVLIHTCTNSYMYWFAIQTDSVLHFNLRLQSLTVDSQLSCKYDVGTGQSREGDVLIHTCTNSCMYWFAIQTDSVLHFNLRLQSLTVDSQLSCKYDVGTGQSREGDVIPWGPALEPIQFYFCLKFYIYFVCLFGSMEKRCWWWCCWKYWWVPVCIIVILPLSLSGKNNKDINDDNIMVDIRNYERWCNNYYYCC